jgi:hypothetical protein
MRRVQSGRSDGSNDDTEFETFDHSIEMATKIRNLLAFDPYGVFFSSLRGQCPAPTIYIDNRSKLISLDLTKKPDREGTGSLVYFTPLESPLYAVKVLTSSNPWTYEGMRKERAILEALNGLNGGSVRLHPIDLISSKAEPGFISRGCLATTLVTDYAGSLGLDSLKHNKVLLARGIARAIEIIRDIHDAGIVHGDIHLGNIMMGDIDRIEETMKVIDFGRAESFLSKVHVEGSSDHEWAHRRSKKRDRDASFATLLLSVFELKNDPKSRRDDMYRLALTLAFQLIDSRKLEEIKSVKKNIERMIQEKEILRIPGHELADAFYRSMLSLKFKERPDYEYWILQFRSHHNLSHL